jgi:hypothetical protein
LCAVSAGQRRDAGVDSLIFDLTLSETSNKNCAGATVAFSASFFSSRQVFFKSKKIKKGEMRVKCFKRDRVIAN